MFKNKAFAFSVLLGTMFSITGCHSVSGNVIPQGGPAMETIYDSMGTSHASQTTDHANTLTAAEQPDNIEAELAIRDIRQQNTKTTHPAFSEKPTMNSVNTVFHKLPNPELKLYVYPHLAGSDELPIPGYYTAFNVYEKTHYALPNEFPN